MHADVLTFRRGVVVDMKAPMCSVLFVDQIQERSFQVLARTGGSGKDRSLISELNNYADPACLSTKT